MDAFTVALLYFSFPVENTGNCSVQFLLVAPVSFLSTKIHSLKTDPLSYSLYCQHVQ